MNDESRDDFVDFTEMSFKEQDWWNFKDSLSGYNTRSNTSYDSVEYLLNEGNRYESHHPQLTKLMEEVVELMENEGVILEWNPWKTPKQWWSWYYELECRICEEIVVSKYGDTICESCSKNELGETEEEERERVAYMDDNYPEWRDDDDYGGGKHRHS